MRNTMRRFIVPCLLAASATTFAIASAKFNTSSTSIGYIDRQILDNIELDDDRQQELRAILEENHQRQRAILLEMREKSKLSRNMQMQQLAELLSEEELNELVSIRDNLQQERRNKRKSNKNFSF
ncbi:hypothetical protein [Agarilytica rhodophyticola]|uniref:hypothetical protein n=1 Tax=Agarilytica rhodophyticola TaxID=1737490 RepID=UPI000B3485D7|nr:hypothetical protein [Agarilytica rhodophyticola]